MSKMYKNSKEIYYKKTNNSTKFWTEDPEQILLQRRNVNE